MGEDIHGRGTGLYILSRAFGILVLNVESAKNIDRGGKLIINS
jgi:hypothetical protein